MQNHLNWLSWLQHADHDVWLKLMEYLEPIIKMRQIQSSIKRDKWFIKAMERKLGGSIEELRLESKFPISANYNRFVNYDPDFADGYFFRSKIERFNKINLHGIIVKSNPINTCPYYDLDGPMPKHHRYKYQLKLNNPTCDDILDAVKDNEDGIKIRKSWKKDKMIKALLSY